MGAAGIVPAASASAATFGGDINNEGQKLPDNDQVNGAYTTTDGTTNDPTTGTASKQSDANITLKNGFLTLEKVPDLSFGTATSQLSGNYRITSNHSEIVDEGNQDGILAVNDTRDTENGGTADATPTPANAAGWTLGAKLGQFKNLTTNANATGAWGLTLNTDGSAGWTAENNSATTPVTAASFQEGVTLDSNGAAKVVGDAAAGTGYGRNTASLTAASQTKLQVPDGQTEGTYAAPITWTLYAQQGSAVN
ncbi:WxL domain-containing protein [Loigolactobacillus binensis]|uniref:WxL domain-containing protein n=1 Tax=Loigolactobacillus binensis TaxID=2559922 RepID=A0ABW3EFR5_9LACO|nr:WxL domain-containing protein [Loigolactobacillus binensis]